uniref:Uncharacterized protein MANES_11G069000 n=1 Tax=Rhizophora mucronata TaxID=61149 RepID=A0A2P2JQR0_RHIMU
MRIHHSSATARSDLRKIRNMKTKKQEKNEGEDANQHQSISISRLQACSVHMICGLGLAVAFWVAHNLYSISLVSHPSPTLRLICIVEIPIAILLFSQFRLNPKQCSYFRAVGRSLLALPLGALVNAFGAIFLGAPIGIQYVLADVG